ncbi:Uncharacterised protein [Psychrobacter phenylpyruvicus]|uniref:Uncharacterized protein n=2 Tax=Psychrobacter phenylpyruvicus TaxID=29432 RepID=A0A379LJZ5_9GAMM|nr:Uncharacterised protein [Psychrobacter phenylpyruvicus]
MVDAKKRGRDPIKGFASIFGLNPVTDKPSKKGGGFFNKMGSTLNSVGYGLHKSVGGIRQADLWVADKAGQFVNTIAGKEVLPTNQLEHYNIQRKADDIVRQEHRAEARLKGVDLGALVGEVVGTLPAMVGSGPIGPGIKGVASFAGNQGVRGVATGMVREADNRKQRLQNMALEGIGGAVGGVVGEKVVAPVTRKVGSKIARRTANRTGATTRASEKLVDDAIKETGIDVTPVARRNMVKEADDLLKKGKQVDAPALVRKNLLDRHGIKGTQGQITRDPAVWTDEHELAKRGANNPLNNTHIENHQQLDELMQGLVRDTGAQPVNNTQRMGSTFNTLKEADEAAQAKVGELYDAAKNLSGNDAQLNHLRFINNATKDLEDNMLGSFVKGDTMKALKGMFDDPDFVLTHGKSEELIKIINARLRATTDGSERQALGIIKDNLSKEVDRSIDEMTGLIGNGPSDGGLIAAKDAWSEARNAARQRFETLEKTPMLKAATDGMEPDKVLNKYILNGNAADIVRTVDVLRSTPGGDQAVADMQGAVIEHFLGKATGANNGAFSPASLNRAINSFGDQRLRALFTPEQIARLNDIKQVADILVQQPLGAHVNHSNTGSVPIKQLLGIVNVVGSIPRVGGMASGLMLGAANKAKDISTLGTAAKMVNGQVPVTKNSSLGLTPEMLEMLGLVQNVSTTLPAATGAAMLGQ